MSTKKPDDKYSDEEAKDRLVAALRGARIAGHMPMKAKNAGKKAKAKKKPRQMKAAKGAKKS
jgi:hypothetical protein